MIDVDWDRLYYRCCIWVELLVQRRLYSIFVRDVGSPDIYECFYRLTGSQRTPGFWGVTLKVTEESTPAKVALFEQWERSNRLSIIFIKTKITTGIRGFV